MGYGVGGPDERGRWVGYEVPATCDHPKCNAVINRGLAYVCGGEPFGGEFGCGLHFCGAHLGYAGDRRDNKQLCPRCLASKPPYAHPKPERPEWVEHILTDESWADWRADNLAKVMEYEESCPIAARRSDVTNGGGE
jgi:hypothetical protein